MSITNVIRAIRSIASGEPHKDYARTVDLAERYWRLITGEQFEREIKRFERRESKQAFEQRLAITTTITKSVIHRSLVPYEKVSRSENVKKTIKFDPENNKCKNIVESLSSLFDGQGVTNYVTKDLAKHTHVDPNAFIVVNFDEFDHRRELPEMYPLVIPSEDVYDFSFKGSRLQYLLTAKDYGASIKKIKTPINQAVRVGSFFLFSSIFHASFSSVESIERIISLSDDSDVLKFEGITVVYSSIAGIEEKRPIAFSSENGKSYVITYSDHNYQKIPAARIGYIKDVATNGRTCVNSFDCAIPYIEKMCGAVSEMDITVAAHVFPQKAMYSVKCPGNVGLNCNDGTDDNGNKCTRCDGTGFVQAHRSAQEVIQFKMPDFERDSSVLPLDKMVHYISPPIELLEFMQSYIDSLTDKFIQTMYNSDKFLRSGSATTATEEEINLDAIYDATEPYSSNISRLWVFITSCIASFSDCDEGITIIHKFGKDLRPKTKTGIIEKLKALSEAGAPYHIKQEVLAELTRVSFDGDNLLVAQAKSTFTPFLGKTEQEKIILMGSNMVDRETKVLYANIDTVFNRVSPQFYKKEYAGQKQEIDAIVADIIASIDKDRPSGIDILIDEDET